MNPRPMRTATKCRFCGKRLQRRSSDRFGDIHAKCGALELLATRDTSSQTPTRSENE